MAKYKAKTQKKLYLCDNKKCTGGNRREDASLRQCVVSAI